MIESAYIFHLFQMMWKRENSPTHLRMENAMRTNLTPFQDQWAPHILGALRIVAGYLFIVHGTTTLFQAPYIEMFANVPLLSIYGAAGILEVVGGAMLILGLFTRPAAFVLSGLMAFAYFIGHAPQGNVLLPILNGGELAALYSFLFLFISVSGPGSFALDGYVRNRRSAAHPMLRNARSSS
jgi:putative oxidoreductase